jgi:hypothetical protein
VSPHPKHVLNPATVHTYGFRPLPDVYFTAVENSTFGNNNIMAITYGSGKFVASGAGGKMAYSNKLE